MAIGAIVGAKVLSGILGGGGPRAPRMCREQQQQIQCQPQAHCGCAKHMQNGCNRVNAASYAFAGRPCNCQFGSLANRGMCGAGSYGFNMNSWGNNSMANLFQPNYGNSFGFGPQFSPPSNNLSFAMAVNLQA